jgi:hypothetical protein
MLYSFVLNELPRFSRHTNDRLNAYSMPQPDHELRGSRGQARMSVSANRPASRAGVVAALLRHLRYHSNITVLSAAVSRASMKNRDIGVFPI